MDCLKTEYEEKMKSITELNYQVHARQMKLENDENIYKVKLDEMDKEKQGNITAVLYWSANSTNLTLPVFLFFIELHNVVKDLEYRVDKMNEEKMINSAMMEENVELKNHLNVRMVSLNVVMEIL